MRIHTGHSTHNRYLQSSRMVIITSSLLEMRLYDPPLLSSPAPHRMSIGLYEVFNSNTVLKPKMTIKTCPFDVLTDQNNNPSQLKVKNWSTSRTLTDNLHLRSDVSIL